MIVPIRRALLSVSNKANLVNLATTLAKLGIELISTGGTAKTLREAGLPVREVSDVTDFPEIMDGRVKTLHPKIHGALLGRPEMDNAVMAEHNIRPIDLLVVNLYPFEETIAAPDCTLQNAIENIDVGGPAMLRAAAKNHERVTVVVDPDDYTELISTLLQNQGTPLLLRRRLATKAYAHTARYDFAIAQWLDLLKPVAQPADIVARCSESSCTSVYTPVPVLRAPHHPIAHDGLNRSNEEGVTHAEFPSKLFLNYERKILLRYGENPHQNAALYVERDAPQGFVATAKLLAGKELGFNNLADADAALECVKLFSESAACVIVKHANPCGVALGNTLLEAYERAFATDPTSAFGGIIAFNKILDAPTAEVILDRQFVEVVIAPEVEKQAFNVFSKKPNVRLLSYGNWIKIDSPAQEVRSIAHGLLVQETDRDTSLASNLKLVSQRKPNSTELQDLLFAWRVAMFVKSNAIVYARDERTIGIGAGQMSRVMSAKIAAIKAADSGLDIAGSVMASDAFFPFRDGIDAAAEAGIRAIIQPGGSMRDKEVIDAANEHGMAMVFTGIRHFRH